MRRLVHLGLCVAALASGADASPWPREKGDTFLSFSGERDVDGNSYTSMYGEYGLGERRTLIYELGYTNVGQGNGMITLQRQLDDGTGPNRLAFTMGAGLIVRDGEVSPVAQVGAGWGRGFDGVLGEGWLAAEGRAKFAVMLNDEEFPTDLPDSSLDYLTPESTIKGELTLGLKPLPGMLFINQIWLEQRPGVDFSANLATSIVQDISGPAKLEIGTILPLNGVDAKAVTIGTWLEF